MTFWPNYNLDLRSYGQLLSLFDIQFDDINVDTRIMVYKLNELQESNATRLGR